MSFYLLPLSCTQEPGGAADDVISALRAGQAWADAELARLRERIVRAIVALNEAPDAGNGGATKREVQAIADANQRAWAILTEGMDPPSRRRAEDVP